MWSLLHQAIPFPAFQQPPWTPQVSEHEASAEGKKEQLGTNSSDKQPTSLDHEEAMVFLRTRTCSFGCDYFKHRYVIIFLLTHS